MINFGNVMFNKQRYVDDVFTIGNRLPNIPCKEFCEELREI